MVLVGPATEVQVLPRLSLGVKVTFAVEEAARTIRFPPVLSKAVLVWDVDELLSTRF